MVALSVLFTGFISIVFTIDFAHTILQIKRDREELKAIRVRTEAGGFGV